MTQWNIYEYILNVACGGGGGDGNVKSSISQNCQSTSTHITGNNILHH